MSVTYVEMPNKSCYNILVEWNLSKTTITTMMAQVHNRGDCGYVCKLRFGPITEFGYSRTESTAKDAAAYNVMATLSVEYNIEVLDDMGVEF
jgi:hypothetical protein